MTERLTNLAAVKDWLDITSDDQDAALTRLIDAASQFALNYLNRDSFQAQEYTQNFHGNGRYTTLIRNWPIVSVSSVGVDGVIILPATFGTGGKPSNGYVVSDRRNAPQSIDLHGNCWHGHCQVIYVAGYQTSQSSVIPAPLSPATEGKIFPTTGGVWSTNQKVTIDGVDSVLVDSAPAAGQYSVDEWGNYSFNSADEGKTAVMFYTFTPFDMSFAVTELIGEWYKRKDRIGILSKTLGGQETITFSQKDMNDSIRGSFQNYKNEIPV
jgi:hypothetical protein